MSYVLEPGYEVTVPVTVDHGQFMVRDRDAYLDTESYGKEATRQGLPSPVAGCTSAAPRTRT